ncbi:glycosyltransferase family 4 protein [Novipirellula galeiformis]|uniref:glycosyltransferase family 4 protein n=1 Tax=Novipirellula galeiformis TaxID=2528004 RepID=UPI0036F3A4F1
MTNRRLRLAANVGRYGRRLAIRRTGYFGSLLSEPLIAECRLIHCHFVQWGLEVGEGLSGLLNVPLTVIAHDGHLKQYSVDELRSLQATTSRIFCVSNAWKEYWQQATEQSDGLCLLRNGVDIPTDLARPFSRSQSPIRLLTVGSLSELKQTALVVDAMSELVSRGHSVQLEVIGDGPCRDALQQQVRRLALEDCVRLRGALSHTLVLERMLASDIFVHASERESFGLVVAEAMAAGLPVVCSDTDGPREIVAPGITGWLFPIGEATTLAARILQLIEFPQQAAEMGRQGRERVRAQFNWDSRIDNLHNQLYELTHPASLKT